MSDLLPEGLTVAEIINPFNRAVVRTITRMDNDKVHIRAGDGVEITVNGATEVRYEAWDLDRGSLIFDHDGTRLKLCTELDEIRPYGMVGTAKITHPKGAF